MGHARLHSHDSQRVLEKNFWKQPRAVTYQKVIMLRVTEKKFAKITAEIYRKSISLRKAFTEAPFVIVRI